jgi:molecular chaperone Hsp33
MDDILVRAMLNGEAAVTACDVSGMVELARQTHNTMPVGTIILGRTIAAATMMSSLLKNKNDRLTLMINGGGPAGTIMAVGNVDLKIKAYIANPYVNNPPSERGGFDISGAVGKDGLLTVVMDAGLKEPYVGKVPLVSGEIGEDVASYYLVSEQQPSIVYVNTWLETDMSIVNAGGLMVRPMPGCSEETLSAIEKTRRQYHKLPALYDAVYRGRKPAKDI